MALTALSSTAVAAASAGGPIGVQSPAAHIAAACSVGSGEGYGYSRLTSLTVSGTRCATEKTLVRHKSKVSGWSCARKVLVRSPVQYAARETCKSGSRRVVYGYAQNT